MNALLHLQPDRSDMPENGVLYRGRPSFMSEGLLRRLQDESRDLRARAVRFHDHWVVSGAPGVREVAYSEPLNGLMRRLAGDVQPTDKANYLYYDEPGMGIEPHVDNDEFSLNAVLMLHHEGKPRNPSALVLHPANGPRQRIHLQPGELIVMYADSIVHAREPMAPGESVGIAAFGYSSTETLE